MIKILLGISLRVDIRAALLNFCVMVKNLLDKNTSSFINTIILVTRKVLFTLYYMEDKVFKNSILSYEFIKIYMIIKRFKKRIFNISKTPYLFMANSYVL